MPQTCENWLCLVKCYIYNACQTHEIYQVLPNSVDFKLQGSVDIHWVRRYLLNSFIWNKGPVNIENDHKAHKAQK